MSRFTVRSLCSKGFGALRQLETHGFGAAGADVLCLHPVLLCTASRSKIDRRQFEKLRSRSERLGRLPWPAVVA